ncbi:MAG: MaoC family dehydratase [Burkholderiaceae bacterium]|jgi:acyl dehydratase|nr:MaoC family dehydratase [Burkholderiaceae bacterium]
MAVPPKERFFEDFRPGEVLEFGDYLVTEEEIVDFAKRYDPQPFHVDHEAAQRSIYGGLIASGWMTGSIVMRLLVDNFISPLSSMGSPGVEEIRWTKPVRPGDRLKLRVTVVETRRSQSKPDRGIVQVQEDAINQDGETVMSIRGTGLYRCREVPAE